MSSLSHWSLATAPQQEADAEASTDTGNKSSQSNSSSNAQSAPPSETTSASKEKETSAEKGKDSSVRTLQQGTLSVPGGLGSFWPVCPRFQ